MSEVATWADVDVVIDLGSRLGEGPLWDHRVGRLAWVDILAGLVHLTDTETDRARREGRSATSTPWIRRISTRAGKTGGTRAP